MNEELDVFDFNGALEGGELTTLFETPDLLGEAGEVGVKAELDGEELSAEARGSFLDLLHLMMAIGVVGTRH